MHANKLFNLRFLFGRLVFRVSSRFAFAREYSLVSRLRSQSDNGLYVKAVSKSCSSSRQFNKFKRNRHYNRILEHPIRSLGADYLELLQQRKDAFFEKALKSVLLEDDLGKPRKYQYSGVPIELSPTTLRYVKVASDINLLFGSRFDNVAEIGCGYGGQTLVNDRLLHCELATLYDLPEVNVLINRYLNSFLLKGAFKTTTINAERAASYDLVISNYAFSELPTILQRVYIQKVLSRSSRGYLTMNTGLTSHRNSVNLTLDELVELLPSFEVFEEDPLTADGNYLIIWGHDRNAALDIFTPQKL